MSYTVNLGCWGSIFAVPTDVVDKYLKISGSAQLKVLLYILRHSGEQFELETIAQHLNMGTFDVKDCIEFWSSFNIIAVNNNVITPAQGQAQNVIPMNNTQNFFTQPTVQSNVQMPISYPSTTSAPYSAPIPTPAAMPTSSPTSAPVAVPSSAPTPAPAAVPSSAPTSPPAPVFVPEPAAQPKQTAQSTPPVIHNYPPKPNSRKSEPPKKTEPEKPSDTVMARPLRPDPVYVAKRISEDKEIEALLNEAQYILGRPVSPNENAGMIMMHDNDGLPCEVILMLLTYGASNQKGMRQIEAMGAAWAKEGILTLEQADEKIRELEESKEAYRKVQSILGLEYRKPSQKEEENYTRWVNEWKFTDDMIKTAYDICVNAKGKYIPNYVNTILMRWNENGIRTVEQVEAERAKSSSKNNGGSNISNKGNDSGRKSSFDINELNDMTMFKD